MRGGKSTSFVLETSLIRRGRRYNQGLIHGLIDLVLLQHLMLLLLLRLYLYVLDLNLLRLLLLYNHLLLLLAYDLLLFLQLLL